MQWIYGLFLDIMSYCANALLGIMSTDLTFFETSVPIVTSMYKIFVAVGWGLLIGNCAFQSMKAMFAGFGFETESPAILLLRTALFGTLLVFSKDICDIGLSIGKNVMDLIGIPSAVTLTMPTDAIFGSFGSAWLLVIIIGFILGFQLIKLFFEIAERYVVVAVLTLLCPVGLAMGGSKSTKDICVGFMRTYASMIVMMVMNVLFLKLILSALATMPSGAMVLPWCLLVVGIAKTARKADQLISKIGLNPANTGDPLGAGRGMMAVMMAAKTIMSYAGKGGNMKGGAGKNGGGSVNNSSRNYGGGKGSNVRNSTGGTNVGGSNVATGASFGAATESNANTQSNSQNSNMGGQRSNLNTQSASNVRFGANTYAGVNNASAGNATGLQFASSGAKSVNSNRFGKHSAGDGVPNKSNLGGKNGSEITKPNSNHGGVQNAGLNTAKSVGPTAGDSKKASKGGAKAVAKNRGQKTFENVKKNRFGADNSADIRRNQNHFGKPKTAIPNVVGMKATPGTVKSTAQPDNIEATDTANEVLQDIAESKQTKDGENNG